MTQYDLIINWIKDNGSILPAKMSGRVYQKTMFGSESSKRCRELRKMGILRSEREGKFERFYLYQPQVYKPEYLLSLKQPKLI